MAVVSAALEKRRAGKLARVGVKDVTQPDQAVTAAAALIPLDGTGWKTFKLGDAKWQRDAWHQYDINGDLRTIGNWIGKACSRARLYLAEVDATGRPGKEVTDPKLQIIAETLFGSASAKAEAQRLLGIHLFVPGESFIVAEAADNANEDRWYVVSTSDIKREGEKTIKVRRPQQFGGGEYELKAGTDLLIRCWTPHPDRYDLADSSVRPGLIPLRAIEQYTKMEFAEVDSRLAGAGILFVPEEMDFPKVGKEKNDATGLSSALTRTMSASMVNREDASSMVPIVVQVPGELIGQIQHITFFSDLQQHLADRMDQAVNRLARTLEIEPEILTGKADMNHWSAWQVDESTISIHVTPLLSRMCDALTAGYVRAALKVLGEDPDAYVLWYDTSMLTVEPDRQKDGLEMWDKGLISSDAVRKAGSWAEGDKPDDAEEERRVALHLVDLDPSKIEWVDIRKAIGGKVANWKPPEPPPAPGADVANGAPGQSKADVPGGGTPNPGNVRQLPERQQAESRQAAALRVGAHMAVQRALELVGKRLLTRPYRDRYADVPAHELHTRIRVGDPNRVNELLASADGPAVDLTMVAEAADLPEMDVASLLSAYCGELVQSGVRHNADLLTTYLAAGLHAGCDEVCYAPAHPGRCDDDARMQFHLPGQHNQQTHGHRRHGGSGKPFTKVEKTLRKAERIGGVDPDARASAPHRQGRRAFAEWEIHAGGLSAEAAKRQAGAANKQAEEFRRLEREADARKERAVKAKMRREELRAEWGEIERKMRTDLANAMFDNGGPLHWEKSNGLSFDERAKIEERIRARNEKKIEDMRARFYSEAGNPETVSGAGNFSQQLTADTGLGAADGVPVEDLDAGDGYIVKNGFAFRKNGTTVVIEDLRSRDDLEPDVKRAMASVAAQQLFEMADAQLPPGWEGHTEGLAWLRGASPGDPYWQKRFNDPGHTAAASAGGGQVFFWKRDGSDQGYHNAFPSEQTGRTLKHEFGHLVDAPKWDSDRGGVYRPSESKGWQDAARKDATANYKDDHLKNAGNVTEFRDTQKGHRITLYEGRPGKEQRNGVTEYGKSSAAEDYAESFRLYTSGTIGTGRLRKGFGSIEPIYFRDLFPARAAQLDKLFPKLAREQKAQIKAERGL